MSFLTIRNVLLLLSISWASTGFAGCEKLIHSDIQAIINKDREKFNIPGIEITISCPKDETTEDFVSGTTTINGEIPISTDHLFQVGSETKSFIAVIILQLEAENRLSIYDQIGRYLPTLPNPWKEITIQQLLNHSSGIYNYTDVLEHMFHNGEGVDFQHQWTSDELLRLVVDKPFYFEPGTGWHYSNTNYVLAGKIIEEVTGSSIAEEIENRLLRPLQLSNTYYWPSLYDETFMAKMAHGYSVRHFFPDEPKDITSTNISWANAAGAIVSTSHDMATWFKAMLSGELFPAQQMKELMTVVDAIMPTTHTPVEYGLGIVHDFITFNEASWWHSGGTLGYSSLMVWLKSSDIFITVNINHISANRDIYELTKDISSYIKSQISPNSNVL